MELREAAELFRAWSAREGMFFGDQTFPDPDPADVALIHGITAPGVDLLRAKQVQAVGINEADETVIVFLHRSAKIGKKAKESLPDAVEDFPIEYRQGATEVVDTNSPVPFGAPYAIRLVGTQDRYTCGSSISVGNCSEAGTLSCLLRDANGALFGLSNNHVSGSCSQAPIGMPIVAPGIMDVTAQNYPPFTIGFHARAEQLISGAANVVPYAANTDVAIFKIANPADVSSFQQDKYDTPSGTMTIASGMTVEKVGRTTGYKKGTIIGELIGPVMVPYHAGAYNFSGPVYFDSVWAVAGNGERFSEGGDSGSLVVHVDAQGNRHAVGLLFAGMTDSSAPGGLLTIVLPLEPILASLGMTLVSGHNT